MPLRGIINTARTLAYYQLRTQIQANNLANATSDAFKADRLTASLPNGAESPVPVAALDLRQAPLTETGRPLDLAIDGPGFFVVQTPQGERLMRGGSLRLDAAGMLVDQHGDPLLGDDGPIVINGAEVEIATSGEVVVDGSAAGRLRLVVPDDPQAMLKEGAGRFVPQGETTPADETVRVVQGAVEESNFDMLMGMIDLVSIQRAHAANMSALQAMDGVLDNVVNDVGRV